MLFNRILLQLECGNYAKRLQCAHSWTGIDAGFIVRLFCDAFHESIAESGECNHEQCQH